MELRIPSERQALPQDMTQEEVQKGGGGRCHAWFTGIKIEILHFTGIKSDFSGITQNSAFDFIYRPYRTAKLRCQLLLFSHPTILDLQ